MTHAAFQRARDYVNLCHAQARHNSVPKRECSNCGVTCILTRGRHSGKWMWTHFWISDCEFDQLGRRIHFDSKEAAMEGEMFK